MAIPRKLSVAGTLFLPVILASCAGGASERYPSLAIREVERVSGTFTPVDPKARILKPAPAPEGQRDRLNSLVAQASEAHQAFLAASPGTRELVKNVDEVDPESNAWADAQIALADLDSHRSATAIALADLDLLYAEASTEFVERLEIDAARQQVIDWISQEDQILSVLRAQAEQ